MSADPTPLRSTPMTQMKDSAVKNLQKTREEFRKAFVKQRIFDVLSDGKPHTVNELYTCLWDEEGDPLSSLRVSINRMRMKLVRKGYDIVGRQIKGVSVYYLVKLLAPYPDAEDAG